MNPIRNATMCAGLVLFAACAQDVVQPNVNVEYGRQPSVQDPTTNWYLPLDATLAMQSDGKYVSGTNSVYANGVCGVTGKLFATTAASNSGDATLQTDNPANTDRKCKDYPRRIKLTFPDGTVETLGSFFSNLHEIANTTYSIPIGTTVLRALNIGNSGARCGTVRFRHDKNDGTFLGADSVAVTRVDARTYDVATQAAPNDRGYCDNTGELLAMPLRFRIVASYDLP